MILQHTCNAPTRHLQHIRMHTPDPATHMPQILHRDIKPSNIFLDADEQARLGDLGLACQQRPAAQNVTTMTSVAGSNGYMDENYQVLMTLIFMKRIVHIFDVTRPLDVCEQGPHQRVTHTHSRDMPHNQVTGRFDAAADGYSMGVTILATLTGWPAVDRQLGKLDARCDVRGDARIVSLADVRAEWPQELAIAVHTVGMSLVERNRDNRVTVREAKERVQTLVDTHLPPAPPQHQIVERECIICMSAPRHVRFAWCVLTPS